LLVFYSMNTKMDLDIENYSIDEIFLVLEVNEFDSSNLILAKTDQYIRRFNDDNNILLIDFFQKVKTRLVEYFENGEQEDDNNDDSSKDNNDKSVYIDDEEREDYLKDKLLISRNVENKKHTEIKIAQDKLNPNLKNTISRMLVIDSQFRQVYDDENPSSSTDFSLDLSEPLNDLINLRLFSIQLPYTWYTIDENAGTNFFYFNETKITIESGNYKPAELVTIINEALVNNVSAGELPIFSYHSNNGKMKIVFKKSGSKIVFFDFTRFLNAKTNNNLGYLMGFQKMEYIINEENKDSVGDYYIKSEGIVDLYGPKYLLIIVDDFNQNHVNSGLINVYDNPNVSLKMPSYFNTTIPTRRDENNNIQFLPESPRQMTQSQLYALNQIQENKDTFSTNFRANAPVTTDVFAFMPIKHGDTGQPFVEFGGSLQSNVRNYFGPVNVNRLRIRLMDDKGNIVNLNGANWSFGIVCETLYQY
jgi:hypothetical protein